jgi:ethanolamine utilization protein EutA (predicted chaperonin)
MSEVHQWINRYPAPLPGGQVITQDRPGERIAKCISEIQAVITSMQGGDEDTEATDLETQVAALAQTVAELSAEVANFAQQNVSGMVMDIRFVNNELQKFVDGQWITCEGGIAAPCDEET